jgi:hypothetical protein
MIKRSKKMTKRQSKAQISHSVADSVMTTFVETLRSRQAKQGYEHRDTAAYALGYLQAMFTSIMAQDPKVLSEVADRLKYISKEV